MIGMREGIRGGYNSDDITGVGVGGGGVEPGGSDDGMTITICTFFALQVCVFAELDESAAALRNRNRHRGGGGAGGGDHPPPTISTPGGDPEYPNRFGPK